MSLEEIEALRAEVVRLTEERDLWTAAQRDLLEEVDRLTARVGVLEALLTEWLDWFEFAVTVEDAELGLDLRGRTSAALGPAGAPTEEATP